MKKILNSIWAALAVALLATLTGCDSDANIASSNLSKAADMFEINRRIVFYNGFTGEYMLVIEGLCSKGNQDTDKKVSFTCKVGPNEYKKHFLGLSDNVTYFMEQIEPAETGISQYRVIFKPLSIVPDIEVKK